MIPWSVYTATNNFYHLSAICPLRAEKKVIVMKTRHQTWARALTTVSVSHLTCIPLINVRLAVSINLDITETTREEKSQPVGSAQYPATTNDSHSFDGDASGYPASVGSAQHPATTNEPHSFDGDASGYPANACSNKSAAMDIDDTTGISGKNEGVDINNMPDNHADDTNDTEMSAPQPLTLQRPPAMETQGPDWLKRMLVYLWGVSDSAEWQDLVAALLKFENLNPPSGVGVYFLIFIISSDFLCLSI
jgi:hypothetical protein